MTALSRAALLFAALAAATAQADYITDELRAEMRSGASNQYRIINFLPAGTDVEVLEEDNDFSRVRTDRGAEGWVPSQYISATPSAADRLVAAEAKINRLEDLARSGDSKTFELANSLETETERANNLDRELQQARSELEEIKRISSQAVQLNAEQKRLRELNQRLRDELDDLSDERERLAENLQRQWLLIGGGLVLGGFVLGAMIKSRPRRSAWN